MGRIDSDLLEKFLEGRCSDDEQKTVIQWFLKEEYNSALKFAFSSHFNKVLDRSDIEEEDLPLLLDRIHHRLDIRAARRTRGFTFRKFMQYAGKAAAILFLPLLFFVALYVGKHPPVGAVSGYSEIVAPRGGRIHFTLPDGTRGWLNSESTLQYPLTFKGMKNRKVSLKGEGYFEVEKDKKKPFIVNTGKIQVKVLGTTFDIYAYPDEDEVGVTLLSGSIELLKAGQGGRATSLTVLSPGEQALVRKVDGRYHVTNVEDPACYAAWKDGKLVFRNDPMDEVVKKLGRWYNVKFFLQEKNLEDYRYHATFQYESLEEVLKLIKLTSPVDFKEIKREKLPDGTYSKKKIILFAKKTPSLKMTGE